MNWMCRNASTTAMWRGILIRVAPRPRQGTCMVNYDVSICLTCLCCVVLARYGGLHLWHAVGAVRLGDSCRGVSIE